MNSANAAEYAQEHEREKNSNANQDSGSEKSHSRNDNHRSVSAWFKARQGSFILFCLTISIIILLLWPSVVITLQPGHVGVLFRRFWGGTVTDKIYPEGTHFVLPWNTLYIFDTRVHEELHTFTVLTKSGLQLELDVSILYYPEPLKTPELLMSVGENYQEKIILPALRSSVLSVAAQHEKEDFYKNTLSSIQTAMLVSTTEAIGRRPLQVDNFFIRAVRLPNVVNEAINKKFIAQQEAQLQAFKVEEAAQRYKISLIDAEAVRMTQEIVNQNMTENFLKWKGIEATRLLAASPNSKFVIAGGRDGLPIILNPEASSGVPAGARAGTPASANASGDTHVSPQREVSPKGAIPLPAPEPAHRQTNATTPQGYIQRLSPDSLERQMKKLFEGVLPSKDIADTE